MGAGGIQAEMFYLKNAYRGDISFYFEGDTFSIKELKDKLKEKGYVTNSTLLWKYEKSEYITLELNFVDEDMELQINPKLSHNHGQYQGAKV